MPVWWHFELEVTNLKMTSGICALRSSFNLMRSDIDQALWLQKILARIVHFVAISQTLEQGLFFA